MFYHARFPISRAFCREFRVLVFVREIAAAFPVHHRVTLVAEHKVFLFQSRVRLVNLSRQVNDCSKMHMVRKTGLKIVNVTIGISFETTIS